MSAMWPNNDAVLKILLKKPIPKRKISLLLKEASYSNNPSLVKQLLARGADPNFTYDRRPLLKSYVSWLITPWSYRNAQLEQLQLESLEIICAAGGKLPMSSDQLASIRRDLIKSDSGIVNRVLEILKKHRAISEETLHELTRTPKMQAKLLAFKLPNARNRW